MPGTTLRRMLRVGQAKKLGRNYDFTWRYMLNLRPTLEYRRNGAALSGEAARILERLNQDGVAISSVDALLGQQSLFGSLCETVEETYKKRAGDLAAARRALEENGGGKQKNFLFSLLGDAPRPGQGSMFTRFALQAPVIAIARAYYGMSVTLRYTNVWHNFVTRGEASQSQYWHRDPEDRYILKVFVCLSDVDMGSGPFTYARGTHMKSGFSKLPEYMHKDGETPRSNDEQMAKVVPADRWLTAIGPRGTMVFADTRGYHKGGLARERERILYTCEFTSPSAGDGGIRC
jgi:hypothetical protein